MIRIHYNRRRQRLTARGHAGCAPKGQDPVCAAVSALVLTLAANVAELATGDKVRHPIVRLEEGDAWISCIPAPKLQPVITMIFDTVCSGFELLQTLYPEHISFYTEG